MGTDLQAVLKDRFGLDGFRPSQESIIQAIIEGGEVLAVMPTGGGKSLCYQLPALVLEGVSIVVSPLISLMQDQVDGLMRLDIPVACINSTLSLAEQGECIEGMRRGDYKLVYVAPERFRSQRFLEALKSIEIGLIAIDEAHCISQWGHDFRPDYLALGNIVEMLGQPKLAAFTATATPEVREDIIRHLKLKGPKEFVAGFSRPNLELRVVPVSKVAEKYARIGKLIEKHQTGIVYCATRKQVDRVMSHLMSWDCSTIAYHGGMSDSQRAEAQERFMEGKADVAVATNAFGMGIDRSDIRFVAHFEMPGSLEAYYQEVGRAGRDGKDSVCEFYYCYADKRVQEFFIEGGNPTRDTIQSVYRQLDLLSDLNHEVVISLDDLAERLGKGVNPMSISSSISILSHARVIERFDVPGQRVRGTRILCPGKKAEELSIDYVSLEEKEHRDREKLDTVIRYANAIGCRQKWILDYFGEAEGKACGRCDECLGQNKKSHREPNEEELLVVQKALSGVARMSYRVGSGKWQARFSRMRVIQMLIGSQRQEIMDNKLNELSTYGILKEKGQRYLTDLFKELERIGLVESIQKEHFSLMGLTALGDSVMRGQASFRMAWPRDSEGPVKSSLGKEAVKNYDEDLYEALREKRAALAKEKPNTRLFMILTNKALEYLAERRPSTIEEAQAIPGIGPYKARTIMPEFLEVIQRYEGQPKQVEVLSL